jgi:hypothetical protein
MDNCSTICIGNFAFKMGGRIVRHARQIVFQLAEVAVPREVFAAILEHLTLLRLALG